MAKTLIPQLSLAAGVVVIIASTLIITSHTSTSPKPAFAAKNPNQTPTPKLPKFSDFVPGKMFQDLKVVSVSPNSPINTVTFKGHLTLEGVVDDKNCLTQLTASSSAQLPQISHNNHPKICFKIPLPITKNLPTKIRVDNLGANQSNGDYQATFISVVK